MTEKLPSGWKVEKLEDVVDILDSKRVPINSKERETRQGPIPYYGATGQVGWIDDFLFDEELVLLGEDGAPFFDSAKQKAYVIRGKSWVNNHAHVLRAKNGIPNSYIKYYLDIVDYHGFVTGTTRHKLNQAAMRQIPIPVAPPEQQKRIVAEIEKQFSRLDEAVANLKRVKSNLKRYKSAVLKAAVEGRLVETEAERARREGLSYETGAQLLQRILEARRNQWQGKGKYKEPAAPDATDLPDLPVGWVWASVDQLVAHLTDGDHQAPPQTDQGIPFLVIGNVRNGEIDFSDTRFVGEAYYNSLDPNRQPKLGDLLYTLVGSYGIPVRVTTERPFCIQRHMAILRPHEHSPMNYLTLAMTSDNVFKQATEVATGTAQMTVPLGGLRRIAIPLPPHPEQHRIVAEVDRRLSLVSEVDRQAEANLKRAERLSASILSSAFRGQLTTEVAITAEVPQKFAVNERAGAEKHTGARHEY